MVDEVPGVKTVDGFDSRRFVSQRTLRSPIHCTGVGLHSGAKVSMRLLPAEPDRGIVFVRSDVAGAAIPATFDHVADTRLCTMLANRQGVSVATVEHLMAALSGTGIDNVVIEVDGPELPIMDGSAAPFVFLIECAGVVEQVRARRAIRLLSPVAVEGAGWSASLTPGLGFSVGIEIDFANPAVARQSLEVDLASGVFKKELARARTFGFLSEVETLRAAGLARGGSLDNVVVISDDRVLNEDGLRYADEFVRHKALDAIGDLYLAGAPIIGHFHGLCTGHAANNRLLRALFAMPEAWAWDLVRTDDGLLGRPAAPRHVGFLARAVGL